jgi:Ser/Thr protein kinase RdoA (MazF antagonist)
VFRDNRAKPANGGMALGVALAGIHAALAGVVDTLPRLAEKIGRAGELFQDPSATAGLTAADRRLAALAHARLREYLDSLDGSTGLHGEPHDGNVIWTDAGPLLLDFEASCTGPLEWDLAYLPKDALAAFPEPNDATVECLRSAVSFCVAAWCSAQPARAPEVAEAAVYHLDALRRSWLAI